MNATYTMYTFNDLIDKDEGELLKIKKEKQQELYDLQQSKNIIIYNILSLQGMLQLEKDGTK